MQRMLNEIEKSGTSHRISLKAVYHFSKVVKKENSRAALQKAQNLVYESGPLTFVVGASGKQEYDSQQFENRTFSSETNFDEPSRRGNDKTRRVGEFTAR